MSHRIEMIEETVSRLLLGFHWLKLTQSSYVSGFTDVISETEQRACQFCQKVLGSEFGRSLFMLDPSEFGMARLSVPSWGNIAMLFFCLSCMSEHADQSSIKQKLLL